MEEEEAPRIIGEDGISRTAADLWWCERAKEPRRRIVWPANEPHWHEVDFEGNPIKE